MMKSRQREMVKKRNKQKDMLPQDCQSAMMRTNVIWQLMLDQWKMVLALSSTDDR